MSNAANNNPTENINPTEKEDLTPLLLKTRKPAKAKITSFTYGACVIAKNRPDVVSEKTTYAF